MLRPKKEPKTVAAAWDYPLQMKTFVLKKKVENRITLDNFQIFVEEVPPLEEGEILTVAEWISVDVYVREVNFPEMKVGDPIPGSQIARVIMSENEEFPVGTQVVGYFGWRDLTVYTPKQGASTEGSYMTICILPDMKGLPITYALGCMGLPGNAAYWGLVDGCKAQEGQHVVVTSVGGCVGSCAAQIARLRGCKVTGFVGSRHKVEWAKDNLKIDEVYNYKELKDFEAGLDEIFAENPPDCYFDTVGGMFLFHMIRNMKLGGRISQVGSLSDLKRVRRPDGPDIEAFDRPLFRSKQLAMQFFNPKFNLSKFFIATERIRDWILKGEFHVEETITHGFEALPKALLYTLYGKTLGKHLVQMEVFNSSDYKSTFPIFEDTTPKKRMPNYKPRTPNFLRFVATPKVKEIKSRVVASQIGTKL